MGIFTLALGVLGAALVGVFLVNMDILLTKPEQATLAYLEDTELRMIGTDRKLLKARELWEITGAVVMVEAFELSSLKPQLEELGVPLYAVVKEDIGTEVQDFRQYFAGEIFLDEKQRFYGPHKRRMAGLGFVRLGVWQNLFRVWKKGYQGNTEGEGFILGGVFVIGPGTQGILLEHREKEFGDKVNVSSVLEAAKIIHLK